MIHRSLALFFSLLISCQSHSMEPEPSDTYFQYKKVSVEEKPKIRLVFEHVVGCIFDDSKEYYDYLLVGPLSPCIAVIIKDPDSKRTIAYHYMESQGIKSNFQDFLATMVSKFDVKNFSRLEINIYTVSDETRKDDGFSYENQLEKVREMTKCFYMNWGLDLIIKPMIFDISSTEDIVKHLFVLVNRSGDIFNTSPIAENLDLGFTKFMEQDLRFINAMKNNSKDSYEYRQLLIKVSHKAYKSLTIKASLTDYNELNDQCAKGDIKSVKCFAMPKDDIGNKLATGELIFANVCNYCNLINDKKLHCGRCKKTYYCNQNCQKKDWPSHKTICNIGDRK